MGNKKTTVSAYTLGCKVNQYDTTAMMELLAGEGFEQVAWGGRADVYIINTCTVTNVADKKSRNAISRAARLNPDAVICVCGCLPQHAADEMLKLKGVGAVVGTKHRGRIAGIISDCLDGKLVNAVDTEDGRFEGLSVRTGGELTRGYVKIQEGCNNFCSYCIIPYVRGRARSRDGADVVREVERLAGNGVREIVLTGIHISSYGQDTGQSLAGLIKKLDAVEGVSRIRLGSLEPFVLTDSFVGELSECGKVCPHFHISLQSGSDTILKRMNRRYTREEYAGYVGNVRRRYDTPAITTDIITGFPGEGEAEFRETVAFAEEMGFAKLHVFPYSEREGTAAVKLGGSVPVEVRKSRARELIEVGKRLEYAYMDGFIGKTQGVLFETAEGDAAEGHTTRYIKVKAKGGRPGEIREVTFKRRAGGILYGEITEEER